MKVLHLSSEKTWRGGEQQIAYLVSQSHSHQVESLVACRSGSAFEDYCIKNNILHFALDFANSFDIFTAFAIARICHRHKVDIVHMHSGKSHTLGILSHYFYARTKLVLSRRVDFPVRANPLTRWKYNHPAISRILCVSDAIRHIVQTAIADPAKCVTVHSGIDLGRFQSQNKLINLKQEYGIPYDHFLVGNTSALADHKDYFTFITVARFAKEQELPISFIIIGDGPLKKDIQHHIEKSGLNQQVIMTGFRKDIPAILPSLDLFLMTSKTEGLGTSILDAFACKVPVVATDAGGIPEMIIHERTGLLAKVGAARDLLNNVLRVMNSPTFAKKITENAYEFLTEEFTKEKTAFNTCRIYKEII